MSEDIYLVKRLIERPQEALLCAKARRQLQSAQPERKSTPHFANEPCFNGIVFLKHKIPAYNGKRGLAY
ncbi:hypothetical protein [Lysinibacillus sp. G4S2]|uniref:hypothetical protein n=1 Tax=Lysinibacillus sp. G4S2 TaxID=3055859 RepID=UPI0025A20614|nr:hypothetical protein [Lysinibacillus sp. G4S2]MDM5246558.1 hypothetical protein [Lysinibacillus sp. G4S2]